MRRRKLFALIAAVAATAGLAACGGKSENTATQAGTEAAGQTAAESEAAQEEMTLEELIAAAQQEATADGAGTFTVYAPTSRIEKAMAAFAEAYGIEGEFYHESGQDLYTKLTTELEAKTKDTADVAMLQDAYLMQTQLRNYDYTVNYVPPYLKEDIREEDQEPLVCYYYNKLFIYNNREDAEEIKNVWQLTEEAYKGKIFLKDLSKESVNKNFLAMLTKEEWAERLAAAYQEYFGQEIALDEDCPNAGYQFIKDFLPNVSYGTGDGDIAADLSNGNGGNVGLIVYSKLRDDSILQENLTVAAYEETQPAPFSGFMYPMYLQMISSTDRPYTAKLFIHFMMSEEGFESAFHTKETDIGTYSGNSTVKPLEGDRELSFWKDCLVTEDPQYLQQAYAEGVLDFITFAASH